LPGGKFLLPIDPKAPIEEYADAKGNVNFDVMAGDE
jgi:DNA anti-recombination protein RmuC